MLALPQWTVSRDPVVVLGRDSIDSTSRFYSVSGVRLLGLDRIAVAFDATKQVMVIDTTGHIIATHGRFGGGPGEFKHLQLIGSESGAPIVAYDATQQRVTDLLIPSAVVRVSGIPSSPLGTYLPAFKYSNQDLLVRRLGALPEPRAEGVVRSEERVLRVRRDGNTVADFGGYAGEDRVLRINEKGGLTGGEPPYRRMLLIAATGGLVAIASTGPFAFDIFSDSGSLLRRVRLDRPSVRVTTAMIERYRRRVVEGITDAYGIREWTMLSNDDVFPKTLPAFDAMIYDTECVLWIRETVVEGVSKALWILIDESGHPIATVQMPAAFIPHDIQRDRIGGVCQDGERGEQVRVFWVDRRERRGG